MFFIMGITQGRKDFAYNQMAICESCGAYCRYHVFMTYMCLSIFFIPCLKWGRQYYVQSTCCNAVFSLASEVGKRIARRRDNVPGSDAGAAGRQGGMQKMRELRV